METKLNEWLKENCNGLAESEIYNRYDEMLDELSDVRIGTLIYSAACVLKKVDETAYNCGFNDFLDSENLGEVDGLYYTQDDIEKAEEETA